MALRVSVRGTGKQHSIDERKAAIDERKVTLDESVHGERDFHWTMSLIFVRLWDKTVQSNFGHVSWLFSASWVVSVCRMSMLEGSCTPKTELAGVAGLGFCALCSASSSSSCNNSNTTQSNRHTWQRMWLGHVKQQATTTSWVSQNWRRRGATKTHVMQLVELLGKKEE